MIAIERMTQKIYPGKWAELEEIDKRYDELERAAGFPAKKRYRYMFGGDNQNALVIERQWDGLAAMETAYEKAMADPAYQALSADTLLIVESTSIEVFTPLA